METDQPSDSGGDDASANAPDGTELLTSTLATMDVLRRALADELGFDEAEEYGLAPRSPALAAVEDGGDTPRS